MEVLLDSNFIIGCVKHKVDFVSELKEKGFRVLLPKEVFEELKDLRLNSAPQTRAAIEVALEMIEKRKPEKMTLGTKTVDEGLIDHGKKGRYIATMDNVIKRSVPNKIGISADGQILVERS